MSKWSLGQFVTAFRGGGGVLFPDIRAEKWPTQGINSCSKFTTDTQETDS